MGDNIKAVYVHGSWMKIGGISPWFEKPFEGFVTKIEKREPDPRNFEGADSVFIDVHFTSGLVLKIKTQDYMVVYDSEGESGA